MRLLLTLAAVAAFAVPALAGSEANHTNTMVNNQFNPMVMLIAGGDSVTWVNADPALHSVTIVGGSDHDVQPGESYTQSFGTGAYVYRCKYHINMVGVIVAS